MRAAFVTLPACLLRLTAASTTTCASTLTCTAADTVGVLEFFADRGPGAPGSSLSYVDARILEGAERGIALSQMS
ncbi:hypothetical protein [Amycolatopsis viridis]|uniref:Secreted protein n=1 Tax=Amycolatopsis viridis TaxID=185678 RepID=A0ABX0SYI8_9PSEU|nr:hypothetical protein [Amycolatopsis viridis]NIH82036.1 hypothetical protein [Amycolatopsis viridis]